MSVSNGQQGNETTFNNAFMSKTTDSETVANVSLNDADVAAGVNVTNAQREHNSAASYIGKAINALKDILPAWVSTAVGTGSDNLTQRAEALTVQVGTNTTDIAARQLLSEKSQADGYASLDGSGTVPLAELPDSVTGAREFLGQWAASTNTPTLTNGDVETAGSEYNASDDGTVDFGAGNIVFTQGDTVIYDGAIWSKIDGSVVRDLNDIRDVVETSTAAREFLRNNGTDWVNFDTEQVADDAATGANATLSAPADNSVIRLTGGALTSVDMIPATATAQRFILVNDTGGAIDINNLTGATAANQIITGTGTDLELTDQAALFIVYDTTDAKWRVVGGSGSGSGGGATPELDNLGTTAINADLIFNKTNATLQTADVTNATTNGLFIETGTVNGTASINSGNLSIKSGATTPTGWTGNMDFASGNSGSGGSGSVIVASGSSTGSSTGPASIRTGNNTGGSSGNVTLETGTATTTRGSIIMKDGSEGTTGHVWTSTSTGGQGEWAAAAGGGADLQLSNLTGTTSVPVDILPATSATTDLGSASFRWADVHCSTLYARDIFQATGGNQPLDIQTAANTTTGPIDIQTGNSSAGNSGAAIVQTGNATGGNSGAIELQTGAASGTTGYMDFTTGTPSGVGGSGGINFATGTSASDISGDIFFLTGDGDTNSGSFAVNTGGSASGDSGSVDFTTGSGEVASGGFSVTIGTANTGAGGSIDLSAGDTNGAVNAGNVNITAGSAVSGNAGEVFITAGQGSTNGHIYLNDAATTADVGYVWRARNNTDNSGEWGPPNTSGTTANRPLPSDVGIQYFDTDLGIPIWWNGIDWVNATGTTV